MIKIRLIFSVLLVVVVFGYSSAFAQLDLAGAELSTIDPVPPQTDFEYPFINRQGVMVGELFEVLQGGKLPSIRDTAIRYPNGVVARMSTPTGYMVPVGLSNKYIVGNKRTERGLEAWYAKLEDPFNSERFLPNNNDIATAISLSPDGWTAGYIFNISNSQLQAVVWPDPEMLIDLNSFIALQPTSWLRLEQVVNVSGLTIHGGHYICGFGMTRSGVRRVFRLYLDQLFQIQEIISIGSKSLIPIAVNSHGFVVGNDATQAWQFDDANGLRPLVGLPGTPGGGFWTEVKGVTSHGIIFGSSSNQDYTIHAVIWQNGLAYDLNDVVKQQGLTSEWHHLIAVTSVVKVKDQLLIVGYGSRQDARQLSFLINLSLLKSPSP